MIETITQLPFDLTSFTGVAAASYMVVELAKKFFSGKLLWLNGREGFAANALSVVLSLVAWKFMGSFVGMDWWGVVVSGLIAGVASQAIHDKATTMLPSKQL